MRGEKVKEKLLEFGYILSDIAQNMGVTPQALHKLLMVDDIKTGVLERIANAIDKDILFFFDREENRNEDIKLTNEIVSKERLLYYLYQRIVDVSVLNKDYLKIEKVLETERAAKIMNNFCFPKMIEHEEEEVKVDPFDWKSLDLDKKKLYNAELTESVRLLQEMFFEQFKLLYNKMRGFGQFKNNQ